MSLKNIHFSEFFLCKPSWQQFESEFNIEFEIEFEFEFEIESMFEIKIGY